MKQWILGKLCYWSSQQTPSSNEHYLNVPWPECTNLSPRALTDVVVLVSGAELEPERKRCKELEFFREAQRPVDVLWPVTLPAFKTPHAVFTGHVAIVVNHEKDVTLHPAGRLRLLVVWTVDIQIVIDVHGNGVLSVPKPVETARNVRSVLSTLMWSGRRIILFIFMEVFQTSCIIHTAV